MCDNLARTIRPEVAAVAAIKAERIYVGHSKADERNGDPSWWSKSGQNIQRKDNNK
jgi:hypothetical protein